MTRTLITINLLASLAVAVGAVCLHPQLQDSNGFLPVACDRPDCIGEVHRKYDREFQLACDADDCAHELVSETEEFRLACNAWDCEDELQPEDEEFRVTYHSPDDCRTIG